MSEYELQFNELRITEMEGQIGATVLETLQPGDGFTGPEVLARKEFDALKVIEGSIRRFSLQVIILQGRAVERIKKHELWKELAYNSLEQAVQAECGISRTQLSNIQTLHEIVFPALWEKYRISPMMFWEKVTRSNMNDILPHMRQLLTGEPSKSESVRDEVEKLLHDAEPQAEVKPVVEVALSNLLEMAEGTNTELRKQLRHEDTPSIEMFIIRDGERVFLVSEITNDQLTMLTRIAGEHIDFGNLDIATVRSGRVPLLRSINGG